MTNITMTHPEMAVLLTTMHSVRSALVTGALNTRHVATKELLNARRRDVEVSIAGLEAKVREALAG